MLSARQVLEVVQNLLQESLAFNPIGQFYLLFQLISNK